MRRFLGLAALLSVLCGASFFAINDQSIELRHLAPDVRSQLGAGGASITTGFGADDDYSPDTLYIAGPPLRAFSGSIGSYGSSSFECIVLTDEASTQTYVTLTLPEPVGARTNGLIATVLCSNGGAESAEHRIDVRLLGRKDNDNLSDASFTTKNGAVNVSTVNARMFETEFDFSADNVLESGDFQIHIKIREATDAATTATWFGGIRFKIW